MKKFYTILVMMLIGIVSPIAAEAASVTLKVDNPDAVTIQTSFSGSVTVKAETVIEYDPSAYPTVYINAKDGFKAVATDQEGEVYTANYGSISLYLGSYNDGYVYTVTTTNLAEKRTATAKVTVVGSPSSIVGARAGGDAFSLNEGVNEVKFIPGEESPFTFRNSNYKPFYRLVVDNVEKPMDSYSINIDVVDGTEIEIEADYPKIPVDLTITVPEDVKGIVTDVQSNYSTIEGWKVNEPFEVNAGSSITVRLDLNSYALDAIYINDVKQSNTSYLSFTVGAEPTEVKIEAHNYANLSYTLNIDDPARIAVYEGTSTYGATPLELVAGDNHLTIGEQIGKITVKATSGNDIVAITDAEGNPCELTYGALTITENMYVKVTSQARVYDGSFVVYVNNLEEVITGYDGSLNAYWQTESDRNTKNFLQEGYNIVKFATASSENHMVQVGTKTEPYVVYRNDVKEENEYGSTYFSWYGVPQQNDVIKIYTDGAPAEYDIHFTTDGDAVKDTEVKKDIVTPVTELDNAIQTVSAGTLFTVTAPAQANNFAVKVDDVKLEPDDDGNYTFTASANHEVSISATTSIVSLDTEKNGGAVYNLQGIKVLDDASGLNSLPSGIYIVGGKKQAVGR